MVTLAKELGVRTELITSALLLHEEKVLGLVEAGLDSLVISVDGTSEESQADVRPGADLRMVRKNVGRLLALRSASGCPTPEIGLAFVAMRRNVSELAGLRRLAIELGASTVTVTNVLPYTEELKDEILYGLSAGGPPATGHSEWWPEIILPGMDARPEVLDPLLRLLGGWRLANPAQLRREGAHGYCRFVGQGSVAVAWNGEVSPCIALMHCYPCYVLGRRKEIRRYSLGNVGGEAIGHIWQRDEFVRFRDRVQRFDFSPCTACGGCTLAESNEEDCYGNPFPVCGDCLWAQGVIQCP
jgi:MoaA/NifB/PqqE/SkfB family radical SAM enzyme